MKKMNCGIRKALCLMLALIMVLGMLPAGQVRAAEGTTLYLVPNANWKQSGARFAIYYWNASGGNGWAGMSDADGDGMYEGTVPAGNDNIIFCRMNPAASANNWTNKWNQTADLKVPTDGSNCYTVKEGTWDSGGGTWSAVTSGEAPTDPVEPEPEPEPDPAPAGTYYVAGVAALCGSEWNAADTANKMDWNGTLFEKVYTGVQPGVYQFKITDGTWNNTWGKDGQNYTFEVTAACDVTITFNHSSKAVKAEGKHVAAVTTLEISSITAVGAGKGNFLHGKSWDVAATVNHMSANGSVYTITYEDVAAGTYEVKFAANNSWNDNWGSNGSAYTSGNAEAVYNGQNIKFTVKELSDITLALNLTNFKYSSKTGATYSIAMAPVVTEPTDPEPSEPTEPAEGFAVKLNFMKPDAWGSVNLYLWTLAGALEGYSEYNTWPGKGITDSDGDGWVDLTVRTEEAFSFIFNDGSSQTADLASGEVTGDTELWIVGNEIFTEKPLNTVLIHFQKPGDWANTVHAYAWDAAGAYLLGVWPGTAVNANTDNAGWYDVTVETADAAGFGFIFNDNAGKQTGDLATGALKFKNELWVYADGFVTTEMPAGWSNTNLPIFVPGTFPGPSWDAASNQMTYDSELGLFVYTFKDVPAANYEYKIAINGSWDENYGVGGVRDGANYSVTVPQQMDVTVYYNHTSHNSVTSVTYVFADITLSGTGIETVKLADTGLTGIYSGTVWMNAGTYTDVKLVADGKEYAFAEITVEYGKDVTFYLDPVTGIYYCNASDIPVDASKIHYDSQSNACKSIFGAVAENEQVGMHIETGLDVTSAVLVVKGVGSFPMTSVARNETNYWSVDISIPYKGEYDYYFVLSNGSNVAVYGDDDGYYGSGCVTDLTSVMPYDLVVYEAGYETPDWMKNAVIYQIFPDRFFNGDASNDRAQEWARGEVDYEFITDWYTLPENPEQEGLLTEEQYKSSGAWYGDGQWSNEIYGGDLKGITERIDYLKALGVNVIYLNPVFWSISNHRYDAVSYSEIDPILGTLGDFEELVAVAEANGMHIILDGVFNHVSDDSVYFDRYYKFLGKSEKIGAYPYWAYVYDAMAEGMTQAEAEAAAVAFFGENYGITDYAYTEWFHVSSTPAAYADNIGLRAGKSVYTYEGWWGYDSMPVIYSTNGSEYQTGNWAEEIISGENSVNAYWISKGMDGWRLDVANEVSDETWQNFRDSVKALDSDAVIIGEIWDDATKYLKGDMYDSVMNYLFRSAVINFAKGTDARHTNKELEKIRERYPEEAFYAMMNLVGSHDTTRLLSYLDGIGDDRNQKDFDSAFPTYEKTSQIAKERQYLVAFLQFTYPGAPTIYYGDEIGMVGSDDPDDRRAFEWGKGNRELVEYYAKLAAIRNAYPVLRTGKLEPVAQLTNQNLLAYYRNLDDMELYVIANNSASAQTLGIAMVGDMVDLVSGRLYKTGDQVQIPGLRGVILVPAALYQAYSVDYDGLAPAYDPAYIVGAEQPAPEEPEIVATGWSGYTTWVLTDDGCLTFTSSGEKLPNGESNMKNYWKVGGVLTLPWTPYAEQITKVVINEGIHDLGQMAFYELPNLVEVVLPDSVTEIREYAFKNCKALTTINLEVVEYIREGAFYGCVALENITFAEGVVIGEWAFTRTNVVLP